MIEQEVSCGSALKQLLDGNNSGIIVLEKQVWLLNGDQGPG